MLVSAKCIVSDFGPDNEFGWYRGKHVRLSSHCGREFFLLTSVIASLRKAISSQWRIIIWRYECWID
jgi:hypothetical protein